MSIALALLAMLIELCVGYPELLSRKFGHPVTWIGGLIGALDRAFNRDTADPNTRRLAGIAALLIVIVLVGLIAFSIDKALFRLPFGIFFVAVVASSLFAQRSLYRHVADVAAALESHDLEASRTAVSHIVGRDTEALDAAGVARAAIESLAENFSDAVVAPVFWLAIAGLPGAAVYKAINTADSMIGHRTERHAAFGWAAARLDDLVNLPASRLAALLLIGAAALHEDATAVEAWRTVWLDAPRHRSPNAGYPEAAVAGALGLSLAGPRVYGGVRIEDAAMGGGRWNASATDIRRALSLYRTADAILIALLALLTALFIAPV
ncbi:MAG: adenosylcobinamide-phosphate synthase CbiB [Xanthobacteraceae bacterium]|jgi:adenosylcobinamide-phosphate synthase